MGKERPQLSSMSPMFRDPHALARRSMSVSGFRLGMLICQIILLSCLFLFLHSCALSVHKEDVMEEGQGQITIYLNGQDSVEKDITFRLDAVNIATSDGTEIALLDEPLIVNSLRVAIAQQRVLEKYVHEGNYEKLTLVVGEASIRSRENVASLALSEKEIELHVPFTIGPARNTTLFIEWDPDRSTTDTYLFDPSLLVREQAPEVSSLLVYVTNEYSNNVSVIKRHTGEVVGTVLVGKNPRGVATGAVRGDFRVYVANAGSNSFSVINPTTNTVETEIPVRSGLEPVDIAVSSVSPGREVLFTANYGSKNVSIFETETFSEIDSVITGDGPIAVAVDPPVDELVGSRFLAHEDMSILRNFRSRNFFVYVANRNSNTVTVLKMNREGDRVEDVIQLDVEWNPVALTVDYQRGMVYVATHGSEHLSVIHIAQLVKGNTNQAVSVMSNTGRFASDVLTDRGFDRLYLLKDVTAELTVFRLAWPIMSSGAVLPVAAIVTFGGRPVSMALDRGSGKIYVVNRDRETVSIVDTSTVRVEKVMPVGKSPRDIAIIMPLGQ